MHIILIIIFLCYCGFEEMDVSSESDISESESESSSESDSDRFSNGKLLIINMLMFLMSLIHSIPKVMYTLEKLKVVLTS